MATYQPPKDMKSLSFFSVYRESFNIISTNKKLFTRISIFNILPLSLISLLLIPSTSLLFPDTVLIKHLNPSTDNPPENPNYENLSLFLIYIFAYFVLIVALSLLAFSSVTYAVACICTDHSNITFQATIRAFKRAWKNLFLTRLTIFATMVGYTLLMVLLIIAPVWYVSDYRYGTIAFLAIFIIYLVYLGGIVYMNMVWIFGGVVAVLEGTYGFKALSKSRSLIKGKARWTYRILLPIGLCNYMVVWTIMKVVTNGGLIVGLGTVTRIGLGVVGLPVLVGLALFAVVVQVVAYLVCKADKGEGILKSSVMDHLDIFVDGFVYSTLVEEERI